MFEVFNLSSSESLNPLGTYPFSGSFDPAELTKKVFEVSWSMTKTVLMFLIKLPYNTLYYATHSKARKDKIAEIKDIARKEFEHYSTGTKVRIVVSYNAPTNRANQELAKNK